MNCPSFVVIIIGICEQSSGLDVLSQEQFTLIQALHEAELVCFEICVPLTLMVVS